jgi:hypothetical protein
VYLLSHLKSLTSLLLILENFIPERYIVAVMGLPLVSVVFLMIFDRINSYVLILRGYTW